MRKFLAAVVLAFALGACASTAPLTSQQQLAAVELTFTAIIEQLIAARNTGAIPDDDVWRCAQALAMNADSIFDNAHKYLVKGQSIAITLGIVQARVRELRRLYATGENICVNNSGDTARIGRALILSPASRGI